MMRHLFEKREQKYCNFLRKPEFCSKNDWLNRYYTP